jgi:uncharacterized glyoxalase superfamily protein PhnB
MPVNPVPNGYNTVSAYLVVADAAASIDFIERAFGGVCTEKVVESSGRVGHAALQIGNSTVMVGENPSGKLTYTMLYVYVPDVDTMFARALAAGGKVIRELADQPYGDRNGGIEDPDGNKWYIGTHIEDVSEEEIARRYKNS